MTLITSPVQAFADCLVVCLYIYLCDMPPLFLNHLQIDCALKSQPLVALLLLDLPSFLAVKLSAHSILSLTPASVNSTGWFSAIYSKEREGDGFVFLTGNLPFSSLNLTFRNLVILKLDKYNFLLGAKSIQMKPDVESSERVMRNEVVLISEHALALQNSEKFS